MMVPHSLRKSEIHGLGVFAEAFIPRGALVWRFVDGKDRREPLEVLQWGYRDAGRDYVQIHSYESVKVPGMWVLCGDAMRYQNHSINANCVDVPNATDYENDTVAARDIHPGEELTGNYLDFDANAASKVFVCHSSVDGFACTVAGVSD